MEILAPYAVTTHCKNYRVVRTRQGLALENCALGEGEIDLPAIVAALAEHHPAINLNIEIHSQFAPFRLDVLSEAFWRRHPAPPGDGLAWYLARAWEKPLLDPWPESLPDGQPAWRREAEDLRSSVRWAKQALADQLTGSPLPLGEGPGVRAAAVNPRKHKTLSRRPHPNPLPKGEGTSLYASDPGTGATSWR